MNEKTVLLANTIWWNRCEDDKVYLDRLRIVLIEFAIATRQVFLRFVAGPELDLSIVDMDRIAVEYLRMRGVELPAEVQNLTNATPPPPCDFLVPKEVLSMLDKNPTLQLVNEKRCTRCLRICEYSGDWYGDLCPRCADETEPDV